MPLTESLATMFIGFFAKICRMVRISTSWKSREIFLPVKVLGALFTPPDSRFCFRQDLEGKVSGRGGFVDEFPVAGCCDNQLGVVIEAFQRNLLNRCFEVCHIQTALERGRQGMVFSVTMMWSCCWLMSGCPAKPNAANSIMPAIFAVFAEIDIGLFCRCRRLLFCRCRCLLFCRAERCGYGYYGLGKRCGSLLFCRCGRRGFTAGRAGADTVSSDSLMNIKLCSRVLRYCIGTVCSNSEPDAHGCCFVRH